LQSWLIICQIGITTELAGVLGPNKFATAYRTLGLEVNDAMYKRSRIYKLMKKFNHLILAKVLISLWETHIGSLKKYFEDIENTKEAQFWSGTQFTVVPYKTWAMGILFITNNIEMKDLTQELTHLGKDRK
jgi:hypothetical protein